MPFVKDVRDRADERRSGDVLAAFEGRGTVRLLADDGGVLLLERLEPGTSLVTRVLDGDDDGASRILADVIERMRPRHASAFATVHDWALAFDRYLATEHNSIPRAMVTAAHQTYLRLCASQTAPRLLHGDLHHGNVLFDARRGWLAIDPKGVVGEVEFEIGAALRNPFEGADFIVDPATITRRASLFADLLALDVDRILAWGFAQAVLAAVWDVEDGNAVDRDHLYLRLARQIAAIQGVSF
jgi:streptomycin 6-kinase